MRSNTFSKHVFCGDRKRRGQAPDSPGVLRGAAATGRQQPAAIGVRKVAEFVNADVIQKEAGVSEIEAARITLGRLEALAGAKKDMAFETTLASHMLVPRVRRMQEAGYQLHLLFFWLPSADMAVRRVAARVASGGHDIPEPVVRRRYQRGIENFFRHYLPIANTWVLMNNTSRPGMPIAPGAVGRPLVVVDNALWSRLTSQHMKSKAEEPKVAALADVPWTTQDIVDAVNRAVRAAYKRHKERGESIVIWRDGKIVTLSADQIEI